jgi:hypothetical protein
VFFSLEWLRCVPMKKKKQKRRKRRRTARHELRAAHAKRSKPAKKSRSMPPPTPWLRIIPTSVEDGASGTGFSLSGLDYGWLTSKPDRQKPILPMDLNIPAHGRRNR